MKNKMILFHFIYIGNRISILKKGKAVLNKNKMCSLLQGSTQEINMNNFDDLDTTILNTSLPLSDLTSETISPESLNPDSSLILNAISMQLI